MLQYGTPTGVHIVCERAGEVLLMRRAGTGFFDGLYSLPGGHVEAGEAIHAAAVRELSEETGLSITSTELQWLGVVHRRSDTNRIDFFLRAKSWTGEPRICEPDKCDRLEWHALDGLPAAMVDYVEAALCQPRVPWMLEFGWT